MRKTSFPGFPLAVLAALSITFTAACDQTLNAPDDTAVTPPAALLSITSATPVTLYYGDFTLDGAENWLPGTWDLTRGEIVMEYEADMTGAPNLAAGGGWHAANVGLFNQPHTSGALMVGFLWDGDNSATAFPTYPDLDGTQDLDDKFNAQAFSNGVIERSNGEGAYNVLCGPNEVQAAFGSGDNYGIWFDRDGVDAYQDDAWGAVEDGTYDTGGTYPVELRYRIASNASGTGTLCPVHAPEQPRVNDPSSGYGVPTGFDRQSDGSYTGYPAGTSWTPSDPADLAAMQGIVSGSSGNGTILIKDVSITGYLVLEAGKATGGGWFIPEAGSAINLTTDGSKATFGFNAKQDEKHGATGNLEFQYRTDGLELKSTSYDWVQVATNQTMFEGTGLLNGTDEVRFRVRAVDSDTDRFEIRIWTGAGDFTSPTYRAEGDLGGGQIVIHKK